VSATGVALLDTAPGTVTSWLHFGHFTFLPGAKVAGTLSRALQLLQTIKFSTTAPFTSRPVGLNANRRDDRKFGAAAILATADQILKRRVWTMNEGLAGRSFHTQTAADLPHGLP
jgi:hypothetical protein